MVVVRNRYQKWTVRDEIHVHAVAEISFIPVSSLTTQADCV